MIRKIIKINKEKCNGCGLCAQACHENAIEMIDGKATLLRDDYCDGLGDCLPTCPTNAISFEEREALEYDQEAVKANMNKEGTSCTSGCPGIASKTIERTQTQEIPTDTFVTSELRQWPVQIKLAPINAPYFDGANLLIAADCTAYSYGNFHRDFIKNHVVLIGCPKLDSGDYSEKLKEIISGNNIKSVTVVKMEVPCCTGIEFAVKKALQESRKFIPWQIVTVTTDGQLLK